MGCNSARRRGSNSGTDSGSVVTDNDGGPITMTDGGIVVMFDSGPGFDSGPPPVLDSGPPPVRDSGPPPIRDSGPVSTCGDYRMAFPPEAMPRCYRSTLDCIAGCTDSTCLDTCIARDTYPTETLTTPDGPATLDCDLCLGYSLFYCVDSMGCHSQTAAYSCCMERNCPPGSSSTCATTYCNSELTALQTCAPTTCTDYTSYFFDACFTA